MRRSTCVDFSDALWAVTISPAVENTLSDDTLTALDISISGNRIDISYQCSFESRYEYVSIKSCSSNHHHQSSSPPPPPPRTTTTKTRINKQTQNKTK
jgi:hypothetical protein